MPQREPRAKTRLDTKKTDRAKSIPHVPSPPLPPPPPLGPTADSASGRGAGLDGPQRQLHGLPGLDRGRFRSGVCPPKKNGVGSLKTGGFPFWSPFKTLKRRPPSFNKNQAPANLQQKTKAPADLQQTRTRVPANLQKRNRCPQTFQPKKTGARKP